MGATQPKTPNEPVTHTYTEVEAQELANKSVLNYQESVKQTFDKRYKELQAQLTNETNIATRYELKIRLEELVGVFNLLFSK